MDITLFKQVILILGSLFQFFTVPQDMDTYGIVKVHDVTIQVEVRDSPEERSEGLMNTEALGEMEGMFFIHDEENIQHYWMKNMKFPIDIIYINKNFKVVSIYEGVPICDTRECPQYRSPKNTKYVLEVAAGFAQKHGIKNGDVIHFESMNSYLQSQ